MARGRGRPKFEPTAEQRKLVAAMKGYGFPHDEIGRALGICDATLEKYFREELDKSAIEANAKVAETCWRMATSGRIPAATFFWLKCRAGWRETNNLEIAGRDGGPVPPFVVEIAPDAPDSSTG